MFLAQQHSKLGTELSCEEMGVLCANNTTMNSTTTRQLNLSPDLPATAQQGNAFNEMDKALVSVPVLCDAGCKVIFGEHNVQVIRKEKVIIEEYKDAVTNLWLNPLKNDNNNKPNEQAKTYIQIQHTANSVYR